VRGFQKIRQLLGKRKLRKKIKQSPRHREVHNFDTASTAGIVFSAEDPESFKDILEFYDFLRSKKIKTHMLGITIENEVPDEMLLRDNTDLITKKDIGWLFNPTTVEADKFIQTPYNLLFDLNLSKDFTDYYIVSLSKANFKVGQYTEEDNDYDLMIDISKKPSVNYLTSQIKNYISILNKN